MWDVKVFQHGTPAEAEALEWEYEPFSMVTISIPVTNPITGATRVEMVMIIAFRRFYTEGQEVWPGVKQELNSETGTTSEDGESGASS